MTREELIKLQRDVIEHVLIASEDGGDMNDIDWNLLRNTVAHTNAQLKKPDPHSTYISALQYIADHREEMRSQPKHTWTTSHLLRRLQRFISVSRKALNNEPPIIIVATPPTEGGE